MNKDEKIAAINNIKIKHPKYKIVMKQIELCQFESQKRRDPLSLIVTGDSGLGKSTIFDDYIQEHDKEEIRGTGTKKTILYATLPQPIRPNALMETLLFQLGDIQFNKGNQQQKFNRLVSLIRDCHVELIMLDEMQHFINPSTKKPHRDVADWFKSLINHTRVPVVLFGLNDCLEVLRSNHQLARRFKRRINIEEFTFKNKSDKDDFARLLDAIEKQLPFEQPSKLSEKSAEIHIATKGIMDNIIILVSEAAYLAVETNTEFINLDHLYTAFEKNGHLISLGIDNPFE